MKPTPMTSTPDTTLAHRNDRSGETTVVADTRTPSTMIPTVCVAATVPPMAMMSAVRPRRPSAYAAMMVLP